MLLYHYTNIDDLEHILSNNRQGDPCVKLKLKHRSVAGDGFYNIFGRYILPKCIEKIEKELCVDERNSLMPLFQNVPFIEAVFRAGRTFDDRNTGMAQFMLSLYEDIDNLDLWLRYGGGGRGVSIGLDTDKLNLPFGQVFNFFIRKCVYWPKAISTPDFQFDIPKDVYEEIKDMYQSSTNPKVIEAFKKLYELNTPEIGFTQRIKETLLHNLINTFDLFHKSEDWKGEKEHRMTTGAMSPEITYEKNAFGDYEPFVEIEFPIVVMKTVVIGPRCGKNAYGMVQSLFYERQVKEKIQVFYSNLKY